METETVVEQAARMLQAIGLNASTTTWSESQTIGVDGRTFGDAGLTWQSEDGLDTLVASDEDNPRHIARGILHALAETIRNAS